MVRLSEKSNVVTVDAVWAAMLNHFIVHETPDRSMREWKRKQR